jgi:hypothetical protein
MFFESARFAFPDLAQGGPGCCLQTDVTSDTSQAYEVTYGHRFGRWGLEGSYTSMGSYYSSFDVSGPFGGSILGAGWGRCVESGVFSFSALTLAGTYHLPMGSAELVPKVGMSEVTMDVNTVSNCALVGKLVGATQNYHKSSLAPLLGIGIRIPLDKDFSISLNADRRYHVVVGDTQEAKDYNQGQSSISTLLIGIEKRFK